MRILKRKKRNIGYYYLQHSFRKKSKVTTREKYIGKKLPSSEILEAIKSKFLEECHKESLFKILDKIKQNYQKEWKKYPKSIKEKVKEQVAVAFTYNTNAIEGSTITLEETRELLEHGIAPNKPLRDVNETVTHEKVFLEMLGKKDKFSISLLLRWHKDIFRETKSDIAGKFRDYLVRVGRYLAPGWQDVPNLMKDLTNFYKKSSQMNPVELASRMHYRFEKIHPFGDGNGRIGRLLMNYVLWQNKYPMLIIEYKKRKSYYKALQKDENHFVNYFMRRYLTAHKKYCK